VATKLGSTVFDWTDKPILSGHFVGRVNTNLASDGKPQRVEQMWTGHVVTQKYTDGEASARPWACIGTA
jgi:hypothetical protein